jgi:oxygen-dependent protoporphyrinogen oxidase
VVDAPSPLSDLVAHAHHRRIVVIGGGLAGLVAALECAKVGIRVTLLEQSETLGGAIQPYEADGFPLPTGPLDHSATETMRSLVDDLGLGAHVVAPRTDETWIAGLPQGAAKLPAATVRGIPANPWADDVRAIIGWGGAWRAYLDRLRPPLTIGVERNLARLVRTRMGDRVLDHMVAPLSVGTLGVGPEELDVDALAPGLNTALTRTGSLGGAVAELLATDEAPQTAGLDGGMPRLTAALERRLGDLDVEVRRRTRAVDLTAGDGGWRVSVESEAPAATPDATAPPAAGAPPADPDSGDPGPARPHEASSIVDADAVIVAVGAREARTLLAAHVAELDTAPRETPGVIETVTLAVSASTLDTHPRGARVVRIPGTGPAAAVSHETARWAWLADAAGPGRHIVRVRFGGGDTEPATTGLTDDQARALAASEASALLGVDTAELRVLASTRTTSAAERPSSALGHAAETAAIRTAIAGSDGLAAVGAWLSGSDPADVVRDAMSEADRVRRATLWTGPPAE